MAENKKGFLLYTDNYGMIKQLPDEVAGKLLKHIYSYVNDENPETDDLLLKIAFEPIKAQLKRDLAKWETQQNQRKEAGIKSAEVRKQNATTVNERSISSTDNVNVNVSDNVNVNVKVISKDIDIPAFSDFLIYAKEKEPTVKESALKNKYDAWVENNWHDGNGNKIVKWKVKLLNTMPHIEKEPVKSNVPPGHYLDKLGRTVQTGYYINQSGLTIRKGN